MKRAQSDTLGFVPQKDIVYNKLLPYADRLDDESNEILSKIKGNLSRAVQLGEIWPGVLFWTRKLSTYMRLYGRKFSKEDHVLFIKLLYELVTIPRLEISMMQGLARLLINLLKKRELLSREDLELKWRPLYELHDRILFSKTEHLGLNWFPNSPRPRSSSKLVMLKLVQRCSVESVLKTLVKSCRPYFSESATQEMLEEWRPLLCPFDVTMQRAISYFELFLPTTLPPELHHRGFKLWFDELISLWMSVQNLPSWEVHLVNLFARLANDNIGYIDWDPYIPKIFTRILRSLNLPVGTSQMMVPRYITNAYDIGHVVLWVSSLLGGPSKQAQAQLSGLFNSIASFFHPSNHGRWLMKLMKLLQRLPASVVRRLHRERYKKPTWLTPIPDSHKLTEEDITAFVESMMQPVLLAMFSKTGSLDAAQALQNLALMRPELVIPPVLEKTYPALETLTEPHQLTATLSCMIGVARSLVSGGQRFPEGPTHMLPLLMRALPGVDPNDFSKCMITFQFIATFVTLVPLVDCSSALHERTDLTEVEREMCSASAEFEDFVLQFMDRCFALIDSSTLEQTREETETEKMTHLESLVELGLSSTFSTILTQCSLDIFKVALEKVFNFATTNIFETRVSGRMVADMCRAASKCHPAESLKMFVPHCCNAINHIAVNEEVLNEEELDKELLWNLQLLSEVTRVDGDKILPYRSDLVQILQLTLHLKCKQGYTLACNLLHHILRSTALIYPTEYCSVPGGFHQPISDYLPIKDWGRPGDLWNLDIRWHVPSVEETAFAFYLLDLILQPELQRLQRFAQGEQDMSRDDVLQSLTIVQHCLLGAGGLMPPLKGEPIPELVHSMVNLDETTLYTGMEYDESRENYRDAVCRVMRQLLHYILEHSEDDTKSLFSVIKIISDLLHFKGSHKHEFDSRWKSFNLVKKSMENRLHGRKQHIRALLIDRVMLQHELRKLTMEGCQYRSIHQELMRDLLRLSTSTYSQVRSRAQNVLFTALGTYNFCCRDLIPHVLEFLNPDNSSVTQQQFKGALYCLLGNHSGVCLANLHDWECIALTWPAVVRSGLSSAMSLEKPSIVRLFDDLADKIHRQYETIGIDFSIPSECSAVAQKIMTTGNPFPKDPVPSEEETADGLKRQGQKNSESVEKYKQLIGDLLDCINNRNMPWKFEHISIGFLSLLLRDDHQLPPPAVMFFVKSLNHDSLYVRKVAISAVAGIMKQIKRPHKKVPISPSELCGVKHLSDMVAGDRQDNQWLQYNSSNLPRTQQDWDGSVFVEKTHWGYYCWPRKLLMYAPLEEQPEQNLSREEMTEREQIIFDHFSDPVFINQFIEFLSLEDRKGKDKFSPRRFCLFKGLFRNFSDAFLPLLQPHMERLVADSHESKQRCVAEIISGLIRGCKHWSYSKVESLWEVLCPLLRTALSNITIETYADWGTCIATACESRDPRKLHWLFEMLMESPVNGEGGSFVDACRLYVLQGGLAQQEWRVPELLHRLLQYLEPKLTQVYKNVRERIGSVLTYIFMIDVNLPYTQPTTSPRISDFTERILLQLKPLTEGDEEIQNHVIEENEVGEQDERTQAIKLLKTVLKWLIASAGRSFSTAVTEQLRMLPLLFKIAPVENDDSYDELKRDAKTCLSLMSQGLLYPEQIPMVLRALQEIAGSSSWHARYTVLTYLQIMVFYNLFTFMSDQKAVNDVRALVIRLLEDEQLEINSVGLPVCIEMCIRALQMESSDASTKATVCKTISCLLPTDLEVKRACQLTEFLLEPTVDSYYAVETLYNEPDQRLEEESMPVPNSLRCELLLVFKTQWPFDPEFWDWRTLKRQCLALMGEEASIVSSIDLLNDTEGPEEEEDFLSQNEFESTPDHLVSGTYELKDVMDKRQKNREMKKLREKGFISARFRNWQAYMQYCVLCDKEFLGHRIVRHAQTHLSDGVYSCPICAQTFTSKDNLVPHVTSHVKQSCEERLTAMKTNKNLGNPKTSYPVIPALKAKTENELNENADSHEQNGSFAQNVEARVAKSNMEGNEDNVCPVGKCRRNFKFFKNLVAHVKAHGNDEEAKSFLEMQSKKVVCQYCRRHFVSVSHLNDHLQVHCGVRPYICIQLNCRASFLSNIELILHKKTHPFFKARCMFPNCGMVFNEAFKLYDHEAHHYKTFTCKIADCGKVFHSLQQLNLHEEKHATQGETVDSPSLEQFTQNIQSTPSIMEQMLSKPTPNIHEHPHENYVLNPDRMPIVSIQRLLKSQEPVLTIEGYRVKLELQKMPLVETSQTGLNNSVIQSVNCHPSDTNRQTDSSGGQSFDYLRPPHSHDYNTDVAQDQPQMLHSNTNTGPMSYNSGCNLPLLGQQGPVCSSSQLSVLPHQNSIEPAISQLLPPTVTPQPIIGNRTENPSTGPLPGQRERFHCAFETCTRHYSSYRSVTKHMKAVHPDFYEQWKVARTKIKTTCAPTLSTSPIGHLSSEALLKNQQGVGLPVHGIQRQNVIQSPPYTNIGISTEYSAINPHSSSVHNHNASLVMEDVLNPIVISQLGSDTNVGSHNWHSADGSDQVQNYPSQVYESNIQVMPQVNSTNAAEPPSAPSCSMMGSTMNRPPESFFENGSQSVLPTYIDGVIEAQPAEDHPLPYTSQLERSLTSALEKTPMRNHVTSTLASPPQNDPVIPENINELQKRTRRNRRTKWPAIVRDGKFVCCRCFRQFNSPKSLGGHLSKRTICKPYEESELNTDLPTSFLDLLNSEQMVSNAQPESSYNPAAVYQEKPHQSLTNASIAVKDYPSPNYPQDTLPVYGNGESNEDILKQIMTESNMSDLFVHTPAAQQLFQSSCGSYRVAERLPGSSVIQHTENIQSKQEGSSYSKAHYPQPNVDLFAGSEFPDRLLSHILGENLSTTLPGSANHSDGYQSDVFNTETIQTRDTELNPEVQTLLPPTSSKQFEMQRKTTEQDVKKRLREQILAGDFQRRSSLCHSINNDPNANSKKHVSFTTMCSSSNTSGLQQISFDAKSNPLSEGQVISENPCIPGTSDEIDHLLSTQSFTCFRQTSMPQQEVMSPTGVMANDIDLDPAPISFSQQQCMTEIQSAFERLNLVREMSIQTARPSSTTAIQTCAKVDLRISTPSKFVKPFVCEDENCTFSSMSSEALWKHLSKTHSYTPEMVNVVKKRYGQYAPFKCQKCTKTFTRNSNLRAHYQSAHKLSAKEIEDLDAKRRLAKAAALQNEAAMTHTTMALHPALGNTRRLDSLQDAVKRGYPSQAFAPPTNMDKNKKFEDDSNFVLIHPLQTAVPQSNGPTSPNKQSVKWQAVGKPSIEIIKKIKEKKHNSGEAMSPYRPYRCVHQGCEAAFTIQHNLILHYRAVHQSALSALEVNKDQDQSDGLDEVINHDEEDTETEVPQISEFRCQVKDCSRVFQEVPNLLQHYLRLHEFSLDKAGILFSAIKPSKFACGYQGCQSSFTAFWKYIGHIKEQHKDIQLSKPEQLNSSFKCEIEGCDRSYATKSNMLRHVMKKHQDLYQTKLKDQRIKEDGMKQSSKTLHYQITKTSNGKENIESNKKISQRGNDAKRVTKTKNNHWTKYGKPSLKTKVEASSMCTRKCPLQYPCMIKGCESVMKSERSILKHYMGHGLSEKYLEQQRSHFIFCKKFPRQKYRSIRSDDSKSDNTSDMSDNELATDTGLEGGAYGCSKPMLRKRTTASIPAALLDSKISNDESSDGSVVLKRKRGRPRKLIDKIVKRKKIPRTTKIGIVYNKDDESDSSCPTIIQEDVTEQSVPLSSFKPMGFEMSFLKFLEQSNKCGNPLTQKVEVLETWRKMATVKTKDTCVRFSNPQNLKSLSKVKIIISGAFSGVTEIMLKQLQDMRPTVILGNK